MLINLGMSINNSEKKQSKIKIKIGFKVDKIYTTDDSDVDDYAKEVLSAIYRLDEPEKNIVVNDNDCDVIKQGYHIIEIPQYGDMPFTMLPSSHVVLMSILAHNALFGDDIDVSCDGLLYHNLTINALKDGVKRWLANNPDKVVKLQKILTKFCIKI